MLPIQSLLVVAVLVQQPVRQEHLVLRHRLQPHLQPVVVAAVHLVLVQTAMPEVLVVAPDPTMFRQQVVPEHPDKATMVAATPLFSMPDLVVVVLELLVLERLASTVLRRVALQAMAETDLHSRPMAQPTRAAVVEAISTALEYLALAELVEVVMVNADHLAYLLEMVEPILVAAAVVASTPAVMAEVAS